MTEEDVHHVAGELNDVCVIGCRDVVHDLLVAHGVERVEHGDGDEERDEVYRVVTPTIAACCARRV